MIRLFEDLPNELLQDIFQYFDARMLYQIFSSLNQRFNHLLSAHRKPYLILSPLNPSTNADHLFASHIHTLIISSNVHFTLRNYPNVRCVIVHQPTNDQLSSIMKDGCQLESLVLLSPRCFYSTYLIHEMIFSNQFPRLKFADLTNVYSPSLQLRSCSWSQTYSLRSLRISSDDSSIHRAIFNACPNLNYLHLILSRLDPTSDDVQPHRTLKTFKFIFHDLINQFNGPIIESLFLCLPSLERLSLQTSISLVHFNHLLQFIQEKFVFLQRFHLLLFNSNEPNESLVRMKKIFQKKFPTNTILFQSDLASITNEN